MTPCRPARPLWPNLAPTLTLLVLLAGPALNAAVAQGAAGGGTTVWRCGASFSDRPCGDGQVQRYDDPAAEARRLEAQTLAQREARLAENLRRERLAREAEALQATRDPISLGPQESGGQPDLRADRRLAGRDLDRPRGERESDRKRQRELRKLASEPVPVTVHPGQRPVRPVPSRAIKVPSA